MRGAFITYILFFICLKAQNSFHLSSYNIYQPIINPASMVKYAPQTFVALHKSQWTGINDAPNTQVFASQFEINTKMKWGVQFLRDQIGVNKKYELTIPYAYGLEFSNDQSLFFSLSPVVNMLQSNFSEIRTITSNDPNFSYDTKIGVSPNVKLGIYFEAQNFYIGYAVPNLLNNSFSYKANRLKLTSQFDINTINHLIHGGYTFLINENLNLNLSSLIKIIPNQPLQVDLNSQLLIKESIGIGINYRTSQELFLSLNFQLIETIKLCYAYGYNFGPIKKYAFGDHEILLIIELSKKKRITPISPRY